MKFLSSVEKRTHMLDITAAILIIHGLRAYDWTSLDLSKGGTRLMGLVGKYVDLENMHYIPSDLGRGKRSTPNPECAPQPKSPHFTGGEEQSPLLSGLAPPIGRSRLMSSSDNMLGRSILPVYGFQLLNHSACKRSLEEQSLPITGSPEYDRTMDTTGTSSSAWYIFHCLSSDRWASSAIDTTVCGYGRLPEHRRLCVPFFSLFLMATWP